LGKGINIAEVIRKNTQASLTYKQGKDRSKICFFISHKDEDVEAAIEIGNHIIEDFGYNIYLDINDKELQEADESQDFRRNCFIDSKWNTMHIPFAMCCYRKVKRFMVDTI